MVCSPPKLKGLSPRVRGNLTLTRPPKGKLGSIPAGAGEPKCRSSRADCVGVYPRGCGGTTILGAMDTKHQGLSPRVRGNPGDHRREKSGKRSIPAGAGEPNYGSLPEVANGVYPRGCGGTFVRSPTCQGFGGSVPAGAGEPTTLRIIRTYNRVYPRGCGGTGRLGMNTQIRYGLSPRVRGNPEGIYDRHYFFRSIPAGAGEPRHARNCKKTA